MYEKYTYDVSALAERVENVPGALAEKVVTFGSNTGGQAAATGTLTSNNTNVSNGDTVTIGSSVYTFKTALTEAYATATITDGNATNVSDGDTITIDSTVYRFKNTMAQVNDVHIGASADATAQSLIYAINGAGTPGTDYFTGTVANASVTAGTLSAHAFTVTAKALGTAGNAIAISTTSSHLTLSNNTGNHLNGGVNPVANEVLIDSTADLSLTNLASAINGTSGAGTKYSTATAANTQVTCGAVASHAVVVTAITLGLAGNSIASTTTAATLSWGAATLTGGTDYIALFSVSGDILYTLVVICKTSLAGGGALIEGGFTGNLAASLGQITATNLTANKIWDTTGVITPGTAPKITPVLAISGQQINLTLAAANVTAGLVHVYCIYQPLSAGASVTAL